MDNTLILPLVLAGGLAVVLASAAVRAIWPDLGLSRWLNDAETRLGRRRDKPYSGYDGNSWWDCDGDGGD